MEKCVPAKREVPASNIRTRIFVFMTSPPVGRRACFVPNDKALICLGFKLGRPRLRLAENHQCVRNRPECAGIAAVATDAGVMIGLILVCRLFVLSTLLLRNAPRKGAGKPEALTPPRYYFSVPS